MSQPNPEQVAQMQFMYTRVVLALGNATHAEALSVLLSLYRNIALSCPECSGNAGAHILPTLAKELSAHAASTHPGTSHVH